jgi:hypothetical protein
MTKRKEFSARATRIANIILAGGGVLWIFVFLYFLYHYGWLKDRRFTDSSGVVLYYLLPVGLAILLIASLKLKPAHRVNLAILYLSITASFYLAESFLCLTGSTLSKSKRPVMFDIRDSEEKQKEAAELTKKFGVEIDTRESQEVITDLHEKGIDAVPFISLANNLFVKQPDGSIKAAITIDGSELYPLGTVSNKVTVLCNENGQWITYPSDEHGFRNSKGTWNLDHVEIAILGDSFAQGYCVPTDKSFSGLIQKRVPATVNLGIAGDGPLLMLATYKEYLPLLKPKIVLWFYCEDNDLENLLISQKSNLLMSYLNDNFNQSLLARQSDIDQGLMKEIDRETTRAKERQAKLIADRHKIVPKLLNACLNFVKLSVLREKLRLVKGTSADEPEVLSAFNDSNLELFRKILSQINAGVSTWGGTLYFVYLPGYESFLNNNDIPTKKHTQIRNLVDNLGIPAIDISPAFQAQSDPRSLFPFRGPGHYTEKGHLLVAQEVLKVISATGQTNP